MHDAALAELVLQVGVHCAERGQLLQRIRKFFGSALRWSRNGDAAKQAQAWLGLGLGLGSGLGLGLGLGA